jgi:cereblon
MQFCICQFVKLLICCLLLLLFVRLLQSPNSGFDEKLQKVGTTAELMAVKEDFDNLSGLTVTKVKAIGRQRFIVIRTRRQLDGIMMADVKILPERVLPNPLEGANVAAYRKCFCASANGLRKFNRLSGANFTQWPAWVYRQYDSEHVMSLVHRELASWNETFSTESMPTDANELSYWVARTLPFEDAMKLRLLSIDSAVQRLRCELSTMRRCTVLCCQRCNTVIANKTDVFSMSVEGPLGAYVNPGGYVHETLTLVQAKGLRLIGRPSLESSWFEGYAWTIAQCRRCASHMGWRFTVAAGRDLKPDKFWGLCRSALRPSIDIHVAGNDDENDGKEVQHNDDLCDNPNYTL